MSEPSRRWPCLMYHATPEAGAQAFQDYYAVDAAKLATQLGVLGDAGLRATSLESMAGGDASAGHVAFTFDDAHASNHRVALPLLSAHGAAATVFVVSSWVGRKDYCSWSALQEMQQGGWSVQSHTASHPFLSTLSREQAFEELHRSRNEIEQAMGTPVTTIALPNGDFPPVPLRALLDATGYRWAVTSRGGPNGVAQRATGIYNRYTVRRDTPDDRFRAMVAARSGELSREGMRLNALSRVRRWLGPARYQRLRNLVLRGA